MADTRILSNEHYAHLFGPESNISNWKAPSLANLLTLTNVSEAVKIDGTDFNVEASDQSDDRSFTDAAGAQSRSFNKASGNVEAFTPGADDTGIATTTRGILKTPRTRLAYVQRPVKLATTTIAAGDEINLFRVITDGGKHNANDVSRSYANNLVLQDDMLVNYIVPSSTPTAVAITRIDTGTVAVGDIIFFKGLYEGRNVTSGAKWVSSDPSVVEMTAHGIGIVKDTGDADISCTVPGSAAATPVSITSA